MSVPSAQTSQSLRWDRRPALPRGRQGWGRRYLLAGDLRAGLPCRAGSGPAGCLRPTRGRRGHLLRPGTARPATVVVHAGGRASHRPAGPCGHRGEESGAGSASGGSDRNCCSPGCPTSSPSSFPTRRTCCRCRIPAAWPRVWPPSSPVTRSRHRPDHGRQDRGKLAQRGPAGILAAARRGLHLGVAVHAPNELRVVLAII